MDGDQADAKEFIAVVGKRYCSDVERELTVQKTSVFYPGDGFAAYDRHTGKIVFRVDTYEHGPSHGHNIVLMDPDGTPILTVRRKMPSLHQRWEGFLGDRKDGQKPLFSVKRSSIFGHDRRIIDVEMHDGDGQEYRIEGSFAQRSCRVVMDGESDADGLILADVKRKVLDACSHAVLGKDVFCLSIRPRFDSAFAMGLVLVLDQISGGGGDGDGDGDMDFTAVAPADDDDHLL